jgi:hypothetical protein
MPQQSDPLSWASADGWPDPTHRAGNLEGKHTSRATNAENSEVPRGPAQYCHSSNSTVVLDQAYNRQPWPVRTWFKESHAHRLGTKVQVKEGEEEQGLTHVRYTIPARYNPDIPQKSHVPVNVVVDHVRGNIPSTVMVVIIVGMALYIAMTRIR